MVVVLFSSAVCVAQSLPFQALPKKIKKAAGPYKEGYEVKAVSVQLDKSGKPVYEIRLAIGSLERKLSLNMNIMFLPILAHNFTPYFG